MVLFLCCHSERVAPLGRYRLNTEIHSGNNSVYNVQQVFLVCKQSKFESLAYNDEGVVLNCVAVPLFNLEGLP